jgi:hypothetical protein
MRGEWLELDLLDLQCRISNAGPFRKKSNNAERLEKGDEKESVRCVMGIQQKQFPQIQFQQVAFNILWKMETLRGPWLLELLGGEFQWSVPCRVQFSFSISAYHDSIVNA